MKNLNLKTKENNMKGITLVALVISIIVLLILATVSINLVINNGILDKAKSAVDKYSDGEIEEQIKLAYKEYQMAQFTSNVGNIEDYIKSSLNTTYGDNAVSDITKSGNVFMITFLDGRIYTYNISKGKATDLTNTTNIEKSDKKTDSFVGCYADIDADGEVDGVIFADLLTGSIQDTQQWVNEYGTYTISKVSADSLKDYYISKEGYKWADTEDEKLVLSPKGSGTDRFYIMSLNDFTTDLYTTFYWYKNKSVNISGTDALTEFGAGRSNTVAMIDKWEKNAYGEKDNQDIWKYIQEKSKDGWFVPSRDEWSAFVNELEITGSNYSSTYGLSKWYWSSSLYWGNYAYGPQFSFYNTGFLMNDTLFVRFATTF